MTIDQDVWRIDRSVYLTSLYDWKPETWGGVGWTGGKGHTRRNEIIGITSNPFIMLCYVTDNSKAVPDEAKGKLAGFYLLSHEIADRDDISTSVHHKKNPEQWRHCLKAIRAFTFDEEEAPRFMDLAPEYSRHGMPIATSAIEIENLKLIAQLASFPYREVEVFKRLV